MKAKKNKDKSLHINLVGDLRREFDSVRESFPLKPSVTTLAELAMEKGLAEIRKLTVKA